MTGNLPHAEGLHCRHLSRLHTRQRYRDSIQHAIPAQSRLTRSISYNPLPVSLTSWSSRYHEVPAHPGATAALATVHWLLVVSVAPRSAQPPVTNEFPISGVLSATVLRLARMCFLNAARITRSDGKPFEVLSKLGHFVITRGIDGCTWASSTTLCWT